MAESDKKTVAIERVTKDRGLELLKEHFPPGTYDWAFFTAALGTVFDQFEGGEVELLGKRLASAAPRNRSDSRPRGASSASHGSAATPMADSPSGGSEGPSPEAS